LSLPLIFKADAGENTAVLPERPSTNSWTNSWTMLLFTAPMLFLGLPLRR
jgi:hypothetical protein